MISVELAERLRRAGLPWEPAAGDRFVVRVPGMESDVFVLSDVVAEVHEFVDGVVVGFNGTVEWALDSVAIDQVLWLPRETQLRQALGESFVGLEVVPMGFAVELADGSRHADIDAEDAYARAVLALLAG
ncbi:MAG: pilus assembly protein CpaE [Candidatus Phosphoribacter sp.]|nr:pilus assembly protein CpaE [Actinomycetales bacterium]